MLFNYVNYLCLGFILLSLLFWALAGYAYRTNARREADDPDKKDFPPGVILLVPFTWPAILFVFVLIFIIKALAYGVFLVLFIFALLAFQNSDLPDWLGDALTWIGNKLLAANRLLIKAAFGDWTRDTQPV